MKLNKSNYLTLDDQEVWDAGDVRVDASLSSLADFFCDHDALTEQVLVNSISLLFSHKHFDRFVTFQGHYSWCYYRTIQQKDYGAQEKIIQDELFPFSYSH